MSQIIARRWEQMRTPETRASEEILRRNFPETDAYRYNSASIRVRIVDPRFEGMSDEERDEMVEPFLQQLDETTQADIMNLITIAPSEIEGFSRKSLVNQEFEDPSPSRL